MGNKYKKFTAARADMLPIKVQILNYFTNFKDKTTDRMPNVVVDLPDLRIPKYFSHSVFQTGPSPDSITSFVQALYETIRLYFLVEIWVF